MHTKKTARSCAVAGDLLFLAPKTILSAVILLLIALALPIRVFGAGTVLIGTQTVARSVDTDQPGEAEAFQFAATSSGTLASLSVYVDSSTSATKLVAGLYASSGQNPGTLLTQGSITSITRGAWNTVPVPPVAVNAGTVYWITILGTGGSLSFRDTGVDCVSQSSAQTNLTALPATWSVGARWFSCTLSAYGSSATAGSVLSISQTSVSFSATQGSGTNPPAAAVNLTNTGSGTLTYTTTSDASWLSVSPASGTAPQVLQVSATLGTLAAGTYTGHITVSATGAQGSPATITATLTVVPPTPAPALSLSATALSFSGTQGSGTNPAAQTVNVTNTGGGSLTFGASSDSSWLSVGPVSGTAPQALQVSATLGTLTAGTYTGHITVTATGAQGSPATITVTFNIAPAVPALSLSKTALSFSGTQGSGTNPAAQTVNVTNAGGGSLTFGANSDSSWLSVSPVNGTAPQALQVSATLGSLATGTYTGHITVTATGAQGSPGTITATFSVSPDAPPVISNAGATSISPSGAVITWTTDKPASSQVSYGTTAGYGSSSALDATLVTAHSVTLSGMAAGTLYHYQVRSADSIGTVGTSSDLTFATTTASSNCPCSIWSGTTTPGTPQVNDSQAVELGVKFTSDISGYITGIRFYKNSRNTGTHTGTLWTTSGTRLATVTFTGESSSGWQQASFSSPVAIAANTTYVASYHTSVGFYAGDTQFFGSAVNQPPLHAPSNGTSGGNGVYVYGSGGVFPGSTYQSSNYWVDVVFTPTQGQQQNPTYSISGSITGGASSTVTLGGAANGTTTADGAGNFSFGALANGTYTITPSKTGFSFNPANRSVTVNGANVTGLTFTATAQTFSISGTVTGGSGATVTLGGAANGTTTASGSGSYSFSGLSNGSYTIAASKAGFTISPSSQNASVNGASVTGVNFTATAQTFGISGLVSPLAGGAGATITLSGTASATTTTNGSGSYSFSGLRNGNYAVTPSNSGYSFSPTTSAVTINGNNVSGVNFTASPAAPTYTISGTISPAANGAGSTVTLGGASNATTTADASGNYSFSSLSNGSYTVTPSSQTATFTPTSQPVTVSSANVTGANFTATASSNVIFFDDFTDANLSPAWTVISRHGEYSQQETECNIPQQVSVADSLLTITAAVGPAICGDFNVDGSVRTPASSWPYITGDVQWTSLNFTYGTIEIRGKMPPKNTNLWPAFWLLGSNCQTANKFSGDTGFGGCPNLGQGGYTEIDMVECYTGNCQFHIANPNFGIGNGCDANYTWDSNMHTFKTVWTATNIKQYVDGNLVTTCNQSLSRPMFFIMQIQTGGVAGTPSNGTLPASMAVDYVKITQP